MNIFGFPNSRALPANGQNLGLRDHRAALTWVHENIEAFGGDPKKITFGGESSGTDAIAAMAYQYPDDPIARAYIFESGNPDLAIASGDPSAEFNRVAGIVGCRNKSDSEQELQCMKTIPAAALRHAISNETFNTFGVPMGGNPFSDNITLFTAEEYAKRGSAGRFARVVRLLP
jgi:carboxylesterase type B